ncbi:hypothetical protein K3495_g15820, partial [Podosphaera aphanis]
MNHIETVDALVTTLGAENEFILGFPWLARHNPSIDWSSKSIKFDKDFCKVNCILHNRQNYKSPSVEEILDDEFAPNPRTEVPELSIESTQSVPSDTKIIDSSRTKQSDNKTTERFDPSRTVFSDKNNDIKLLKASEFFRVARQEGVQVMRIMAKDLATPNIDHETNLKVPLLSDSKYQELLTGQGDIVKWKAQFPEPFHAFIDLFFNSNFARLNKVTDEDVTKFFMKANRPPPKIEDIKRRMPKVYHDIADVALPQDATNLPPHRSYDHKIELLPGNYKFPRSRARPCSPSELSVIKRWLDDQLSKGWIRPSTSQVASPILLAKKPGGGIRICHDFRGINAITMKNRYPLPLIKETLDLICGAKIF